MRRASCRVLSLLLGLVLCSMARAGTEETVAIGEIPGKVLMPDGSPAAGANVRVMCLGQKEGWAGAYEPLCTLEATAASDGTFRLQPDPSAKEKLSGQHCVQLAIVATHQNAGFTGRIAYLGGSESEPLNLVVLRLNEPSTLSGAVTDAGGGPLVQATVILTGWWPRDAEALEMVPEMSLFHGKTRADGTFTFEGVPREGRFNLFVQEEGYPDVFVMGAPNPVSIAVPKPGSLTGRVVSASGEPAVGCHVWFSAPMDQKLGEPGTLEGKKEVATGPDGRFTATPLFPAAYDLQVEPPAGGKDRWAPALITQQTVAAGETKDLGAIVLKPGGTLAGKVTDSETGKPIPDAGVSVKAEEARSSVGEWFGKTDAHGHYEFRLPPGKYQAYALLSGYISPLYFGGRPTLTVKTGGRREQAFKLQPLFEVKGRLLLPDGSPAANCEILVTSSFSEQLVRSDSSGRLTLHGLPRGDKVDLNASDVDHGARLATSLTVSEDKSELTFTMEKAAVCLVTGRVVDEEGKPVAGIPVAVNNWCYTGPDGRYSIRVLQGGEAHIWLGEGGRTIAAHVKLRLDSDHIDTGDLVYGRSDQ